MDSHFQTATLVASPSYPNSIAWSKENLVALASGHIITILNPASLVYPRGLITLPPNKPFPIGTLEREDILPACLMPTSLACDSRPCARSLSWSHPGFSPNSGCLLAVCTNEGRVKLYRAPFCEYSAEWIEVKDISDMLYVYLESINFGKPKGQTNLDCLDESTCAAQLQTSIATKIPKLKKLKTSNSRVTRDTHTFMEELADDADRDIIQENRFNRSGPLVLPVAKPISTNADLAIKPCSIYKQGSQTEVMEASIENFTSKVQQCSGRRSRKGSLHGTGGNVALPRITAAEYASRTALLSSLIVAWSPILDSCCSILAVGGKSGFISFWRICRPQNYTIEHGGDTVDVVFIGLLQAHKAWITAISWATCASSSSRTQLILTTGSSDGSVKMWSGDIESLVESTESIKNPFHLLREVIAATSVPISTVSLVVPVQSPSMIFLAIAKGCGSLEIWKYDKFSTKLQSAGLYHTHDQVVTGMAWAFGGHCLYSCSQDSSVRSWLFNGSLLYEVPFTANCHKIETSTKHLQLSDPCFGLALSPGELMIAVVRCLDVELLNPMYQARMQKAAVEFFWTGEQQLSSSSEHLNCAEACSPSPERALICWESNILRSLEHYESPDGLLVLWDVIEALRALKKSAPRFVENILLKWISSWFPEFQSGASIEEMLLHLQTSLSDTSSRKIHLVNIICRRLMLAEVNAHLPNGLHKTSNGSSNDGEQQRTVWKKFIVNSERELRQRLVFLAFRAILSHASNSPTVPPMNRRWFPVGIAQMEQWIGAEAELIDSRLKDLVAEIRESRTRMHTISRCATEERCSFCSSSVPFVSPEVANCKGSNSDGECKKSHRLSRCAVSMQLCSITTPMWFCICCQRSAANLTPRSFFTMSKSPIDDEHDSSALSQTQMNQEPFCPFCGIMLQRLLPEFLLSPTPV